MFFINAFVHHDSKASIQSSGHLEYRSPPTCALGLRRMESLPALSRGLRIGGSALRTVDILRIWHTVCKAKQIVGEP